MLKSEVSIPWEKRDYINISPINGRQVLVEGKEVPIVQTCGTQYLGILWNNEINSLIKKRILGLDSLSIGSIGSPYLGGSSFEKDFFEKLVSKKLKAESAMAFVSGWNACYSISNSFSEMFDYLVVDKSSHNSIFQGFRGSSKSVMIYDFNRDSVEINDKIDAMDGTIALMHSSIDGISGEIREFPLSEKNRNKVIWIIDESHAFPMFGENGHGCLANGQPDLRIIGLSKGFGSMGAVVVGRAHLVDLLKQSSFPWMFSTATPPLLWKINETIFLSLDDLEIQRKKVFELAAVFRDECKKLGLEFSGEHHITGVSSPPTINSRDFTEKLIERGFLSFVSKYPTRPKDKPIVRVSFNPFHLETDCQEFACCLSSVFKSCD